jgi:ring-1,2-phenylacetyl-CoA epoxidase subunit PaaC
VSADHHLTCVLRLADTSLVHGQRLAEWVGHAPALEEELALANISLDLIGQARALLTYAGELEGLRRTEDDFAFLREQHMFRNTSLVEQPNGDFAMTVVRLALASAHQLELYTALKASTDARLAGIAAKAVKETTYHFRFASGWVVRLGDGTEESQRRTQAALERLWRFTHELFAPDAADEAVAQAGIGPLPGDLRSAWSQRIDQMLDAATLRRPADSHYAWHGKRGQHTEHLGYLLAEMQSLHRAHPGATW